VHRILSMRQAPPPAGSSFHVPDRRRTALRLFAWTLLSIAAAASILLWAMG
jgi:hypothetical protein